MQLDGGRIRAVGKSENLVGDGGVEIEGHLIEKVFAYTGCPIDMLTTSD